MKRTLLLLSCLLLSQTHVYSAELAKDGATSWKIVLPDAPTLVEKTAARELAEHLKLVTGADFPTLAEKDVPADGTSLMFVGQTAKAPKKDYKFDEILIKLDGGNLIFAGHPKRGCLYAVYSFLQDVVGVRWWTPADTFIPKRPTLVVADDLNVSYAPQMISREMYHRLAQPTVFSARMKGNGFLTPEYGGAVRIINFVHSFYKYLPPEKYFAAHPDWYSEIDGKRKHEQAQLCLTNDEMTQELIKNVLESLRKDPEAKIIDVSQNDWHGFCTCAKCKAIDDAEESHAGTLLVMLNKVAAAVEKEFPDVLVESLAYQYTRQPPKTIKPRDNVLIRLCTIECSYIQPLDGEQNQKFAADIAGWSKLAKHLFIWDYTTNYNDYLGPHPNLRVLVPNVRYFVKHGAIGLFEEGEGDDFCELKNWLLMRVMWEPQLDGEKLIDEFVRGYYGEAVAPLIKQYWDVLIAQAEKEKIYLGCFGVNSAKWIDLTTLNQVTEIMNKAVETATRVYGPDSDELRRLRKSKMGVDHVWLSRYYPLRCEAREEAAVPRSAGPGRSVGRIRPALPTIQDASRGDFAGTELRAVPGRSEGGLPRAEESAGDLPGRPGRRLGRVRRPVVQQLQQRRDDRRRPGRLERQERPHGNEGRLEHQLHPAGPRQVSRARLAALRGNPQGRPARFVGRL